ncbi:hypothetical protein Anapl_04204 [Anas platyrhynchos]|uniref:Uncharacterized protein n=1 Tax=Anas platyrhynchos TaxID=8839 RepID=R0LBR6_ANAPL|nr:hypothetical protein Anapl_04204 [Anas platyrhynchos]
MGADVLGRGRDLHVSQQGQVVDIYGKQGSFCFWLLETTLYHQPPWLSTVFSSPFVNASDNAGSGTVSFPCLPLVTSLNSDLLSPGLLAHVFELASLGKNPLASSLRTNCALISRNRTHFDGMRETPSSGRTEVEKDFSGKDAGRRRASGGSRDRDTHPLGWVVHVATVTSSRHISAFCVALNHTRAAELVLIQAFAVIHPWKRAKRVSSLTRHNSFYALLFWLKIRISYVQQHLLPTELSKGTVQLYEFKINISGAALLCEVGFHGGHLQDFPLGVGPRWVKLVSSSDSQDPVMFTEDYLHRCLNFFEALSRSFTPLSPLVQLSGTPPLVAERGFSPKGGSSPEQKGPTEK